jgi:hypothetical protein
MEFDWESCWRGMQRHPEWFFPYGTDQYGNPVGECVICQRAHAAGIDEQICTCSEIVALRKQVNDHEERLRFLEHGLDDDGE